MKAIGYVRCAVCEVLLRGYPPRGWKPGDELCTWQHRIGGMEDGGPRTRCAGSYKPGVDSRLDSALAAERSAS